MSKPQDYCLIVSTWHPNNPVRQINLAIGLAAHSTRESSKVRLYHLASYSTLSQQVSTRHIEPALTGARLLRQDFAPETIDPENDPFATLADARDYVAKHEAPPILTVIPIKYRANHKSTFELLYTWVVEQQKATIPNHERAEEAERE